MKSTAKSTAKLGDDILPVLEIPDSDLPNSNFSDGLDLCEHRDGRETLAKWLVCHDLRRTKLNAIDILAVEENIVAPSRVRVDYRGTIRHGRKSLKTGDTS